MSRGMTSRRRVRAARLGVSAIVCMVTSAAAVPVHAQTALGVDAKATVQQTVEPVAGASEPVKHATEQVTHATEPVADATAQVTGGTGPVVGATAQVADAAGPVVDATATRWPVLRGPWSMRRRR